MIGGFLNQAKTMFSAARTSPLGNKIAGAAAKSATNVKNFDAGGATKGLLFGTAMMMIMPASSPEERLDNVKTNAALWFLTMGMKNPVRQALWQTAITMAPASGELLRGLVTSHRGVEASRTSAAIPFSHSPVAMEQSLMTLQYAQGRINSAYQGLGAQAALYSAKYLQR